MMILSLPQIVPVAAGSILVIEEEIKIKEL
jgi:hypothetical protein